MDLKTHSLKDELDNDELDKLIEYIKPLMISATDKILLIKITIYSTLINFLLQEVLRFKMMF